MDRYTNISDNDFSDSDCSPRNILAVLLHLEKQNLNKLM